MGGRTVGLGQELLGVHRELRARVSRLERTVRGEGGDVEAFRDSCLAFCRGLRRHHLGEDDGAFPVLRRHRPDLADTLDALVRDHEFLDPLLDRLEVLVTERPAVDDDGEVERELGGIAAVLENHLSYEERVLVDVLDRLEVDAGSVEAEAVRAPLAVFDPPGT